MLQAYPICEICEICGRNLMPQAYNTKLLNQILFPHPKNLPTPEPRTSEASERSKTSPHLCQICVIREICEPPPMPQASDALSLNLRDLQETPMPQASKPKPNPNFSK